MVGYQLINREVTMDLENHHLATIILVIDEGKNHQWRLDLEGNFDEMQHIYEWSFFFLRPHYVECETLFP